MKRIAFTLLLLVTLTLPSRATWSIIVIDPKTKAIGMAGASCTSDCSGIGSIIPGTGAIIVQAMSNYNAHAVGRRAILNGRPPEEIITGLQEARFDPTHQQYAIVTLAHLTPVTYTGDSTIFYNGALTGQGISVQGNLLANKQTLQAIFEAVVRARATSLPIHETLMLALEAGAAAGGDKRCGDQKAQSAFIRVARPTDDAAAPYLNLVVTDQQKGGANAVITLRQQYEQWINKTRQPLTAHAASPGMDARAEAMIQQLGTSFVQEKTHVGLSIGIVRNGQTHFYNFGTTEKGKSLPPTPATVYEIGSITKTFGSLLLARAVVDGRVKLDDDIRTYLDGDYPNLAYDGKPIRLVHLTNWTSELPDNFPDKPDAYKQANPDSIPFLIVRGLSGYTKPNFFSDLHAVTLKAAPGQHPRHSNVAAQLVGYILEKIYQRPFRELVRTQIEEPLRMSPSFATELSSPLCAIGYDGKGNPMPFFTMREAVAAGGLRYSAADLLKYAAYQLDETNKAVRLSHQLTWGNPDKLAFGLNWFLHKTIDSKRRIEHSGGTFGFASYCDLYPDQRTGIVLLANDADQSTQNQLGDLSQKIMAALFGEPAALTALNTALKKRGYAQAIAVVREVKKKHPELFLSEDYVNSWGYALVGQGKLQEAIAIFKLNVSLYPKGYNTYDSLAETYERMGNRKLAIDNYRRSLSLNPGNTNAVDFLKKWAN